MPTKNTPARRSWFRPSAWRPWLKYFGIGSRSRGFGSVNTILDSPAALAEFLNSRASHVAQTSLYGYMKTRAGTRFPQLFETPALLTSINLAKWHIWLACLSDLTVYSGMLLHAHAPLEHGSEEKIRTLLLQIFTTITTETGIPKDIYQAQKNEDFTDAVKKVKTRIQHASFEIKDADAVFTESPQALVHWAPVADQLKQYDEEIVRNSVRFRWIEIRRRFNKQLRAEAIMNAELGVE